MRLGRTARRTMSVSHGAWSCWRRLSIGWPANSFAPKSGVSVVGVAPANRLDGNTEPRFFQFGTLGTLFRFYRYIAPKLREVTEKGSKGSNATVNWSGAGFFRRAKTNRFLPT